MDEEKTLKVSECFTSIQGEGIYTGTPSVFLRLAGCNLACCFKGSPCDSMFASHPNLDTDKVTAMPISKVSEMIGQQLDAIGGNPDNSHVVITGGEPLLQQEGIIELLSQEDWWNSVTIETNGSIVPDISLLKGIDMFFSVSPKLSTSCCFEGSNISEGLQNAHRERRINIKALSKIILHSNYQLKFVYSGPECEDEIKDILMKVHEYITSHVDIELMDITDKLRDINSHVMLMPEGLTNEQISNSAKLAVDACIRNGWRYCDRTHIRIWGDKRGV